VPSYDRLQLEQRKTGKVPSPPYSISDPSKRRVLIGESQSGHLSSSILPVDMLVHVSECHGSRHGIVLREEMICFGQLLEFLLH
ncbi:MAG: hypothetical protein ACRD6W_00520, partial [Nitrososphaerales archaeon]